MVSESRRFASLALDDPVAQPRDRHRRDRFQLLGDGCAMR
jgi:hypothetical protein